MNEMKKPILGDQIDLVELAKTTWSYRKAVIVILLICLVLGVFFAKLSEKVFQAQSTFIPQTGDADRMGGNLGGLASLAGINLGGATRGNDIPPSLYPKFVSSVRFKKSLLNALVQPEGHDTPVTYAYYYENIYKPKFLSTIPGYIMGVPGKIISTINNNKDLETEIPSTKDVNLVKLTSEEVTHFNRMDKQITVMPNDKQGIVELSFAMPEPLMAAQMALFTEELLQKELINYKIQSAREQLNFTEERFQEKKTEFEGIQNKLAIFRDRNQNISSAMARNQLERMEAEYNFSFTVYTELAKQLEQAKLQVSKETPIFVVIDPVTIPSRKSNPNLMFVMGVSFAIGILASAVYIIGREMVKGFNL